ncbi:hypothetical protein B0A48_16720 [Cryoendolithus antarcticus]|uniref:Uncharacterized protein n=1 Tax=Cryoendolithus antarcticus TaxID=1507870 RepID=A0A1V8SEI6_9PEZI|nr:hypothetical protein B0A48_16720 [Cryoendolithus antarcticus]
MHTTWRPEPLVPVYFANLRPFAFVIEPDEPENKELPGDEILGSMSMRIDGRINWDWETASLRRQAEIEPWTPQYAQHFSRHIEGRCACSERLDTTRNVMPLSPSPVRAKIRRIRNERTGGK